MNNLLLVILIENPFLFEDATISVVGSLMKKKLK